MSALSPFFLEHGVLLTFANNFSFIRADSRVNAAFPVYSRKFVDRFCARDLSIGIVRVHTDLGEIVVVLQVHRHELDRLQRSAEFLV